MELVSMLFLIMIAAVSFIPVIKMNGVRDDSKYKCLRYLINSVFAWTILIFLERIVANMQVVYYLHMFGFPLKFLLASLMVCTIANYIEIKFPKWLFVIFGLGFLAEIIAVFFNQKTNLILVLTSTSLSDLDMLYSAAKGWFFIVHLVVLYTMLILSIAYLFYYFYKHREVRHYKSISITMGISVFIVLAFNLVQLLLVQVSLDLTYISLVIVSYALYQVIFNKDMIYNLKVSGRGEILSNMREIYIITDEHRNVVDVSLLLMEKYHLSKEDYIGKNFDVLLEELQKHVVIYLDYDIDEKEISEKDHYHLREKKFKLRGFKEYGYMILLYDETQVYRLLRELNHLSYYDYMTGLHNRNYMEHKLESITHTNNIGVVSLDINGLKTNNDYLGHERGDYLLKQLAMNMKTVMENIKNHYMARIGGDEFLIVLEDTNLDLLQQIKENILKLCENEDISKLISVSVGIAFSKDDMNIYKLIREADEDMYKMKQNVSEDYSLAIVEYAKKSDQYIR